MPAGRRWIFHTLRVANFRGNHVAKFSSDLTMPRESPYCLSRTRLAQIQDACSAYELEVTAEMELWTPEEAKEYFASRGAIRPAADQMSHRTREDRAAPLDKTGARDARRPRVPRAALSTARARRVAGRARHAAGSRDPARRGPPRAPPAVFDPAGFCVRPRKTTVQEFFTSARFFAPAPRPPTAPPT